MQVTGKKFEQKLYRRHSGYSFTHQSFCGFGMFKASHCALTLLRHNRYTGNLKETALKDLHTAKPTEVRPANKTLGSWLLHLLCLLTVAAVRHQALRLSIRGMLPKNKLRDRIMAQRLILYEVSSHAATAAAAATLHTALGSEFFRGCRGRES